VSWADVEAKLDGRQLVRHAVLTVGGTWSQPGTQYPSFVVSGLNEFVDDGLCYEVPVPYPAAFGPIGGAPTSPSYQQSVSAAEAWIANWITSHPLQTFVPIGYSQGGEVVSRIAMRLMAGDLNAYLPNLVGGITFGNPCRPQGAHAPTIADPGGRGISPTLMTQLPTINGRVIWADYVHSPANGDAGRDMYASVPTGQVGQDMVDVYNAVTNLQFNNFPALTQMIVNTLTAAVHDLGLTSGTAAGLLKLPIDALIGLGMDLLAGPQTDATPGASAAVQAMIEGLKFLAAPGGPTAPHISYIGELGGYSNLVAHAVGFLADIARLTPARTAA
jgi:hypothetical protein